MEAALRRLTAGLGPYVSTSATGWSSVFAALIAAVSVVPVASGLAGTLLPAFGFLPALGGVEATFQPWRDLLAEPGLAGSVAVTLFTGFSATVLSLLAAAGLLCLVRRPQHLARLDRLSAPLLAVPHAATAIGFAFLIAPSGLLARLAAPLLGWEQPPAIVTDRDPLGLSLILALVVKEVPFLLVIALAQLPRLDVARTLAIAAGMGRSPSEAWLCLILPRLYGLMRLPVLAVLAYSLSVVDMSLVIGPANPPTLSVLVLRMTADPDLTRGFTAASGAILQTLTVAGSIALWLFAEWLVARRLRPGRLADAVPSPALGMGGVVGIIVLGAAAISLLVLAVWSVAWSWRFPELIPSSIRVDIWRSQAGAVVETLASTAGLAVAVTFVALVLVIGSLNCERRRSHPRPSRMLLLFVPLLVPQIGFLFGIQVLLSGLDLSGCWIAVAATHLVFVLPYVYLSLADPWRALDPRWERVGATLGHGRWTRFWRIVLPLMLRPILASAAVGIAVSVSLYLPTIFAGAGRIPTVTTEAVAIASGGDRRVAAVWALAQTVLPWLAFATAIGVPALVFRNRRGMKS